MRKEQAENISMPYYWHCNAISALSSLMMGLLSSSSSSSCALRSLGKPMARRLELSLTSVGGGREGVGDVVGGVVPGGLVQSLEGGMKPSRSALASALTYCMLFLSKEAFDTVI